MAIYTIEDVTAFQKKITQLRADLERVRGERDRLRDTIRAVAWATLSQEDWERYVIPPDDEEVEGMYLYTHPGDLTNE